MTPSDEVTLDDVGLDAVNELRRTCDGCETETVHVIALQLRAEGDDDDGYDREPYRTLTCVGCGAETTQRLNNVRTDGGTAVEVDLHYHDQGVRGVATPFDTILDALEYAEDHGLACISFSLHRTEEGDDAE